MCSKTFAGDLGCPLLQHQNHYHTTLIEYHNPQAHTFMSLLFLFKISSHAVTCPCSFCSKPDDKDPNISALLCSKSLIKHTNISVSSDQKPSEHLIHVSAPSVPKPALEISDACSPCPKHQDNLFPSWSTKTQQPALSCLCSFCSKSSVQGFHIPALSVQN